MKKCGPSICAVTLLLFVTNAAFAQKPGQSKSRTIQGVKDTETKPKSNNPQKGPSQQDQEFVKAAAIGDRAEIELGQMAQGKASNPKVKAFGQRMVKDHSESDDLLKGIAQQQHVGLPSELDPKHKAAKEGLQKKSGAEFDADYMRMMVQDHQETIQKFEKEESTTQDATLKEFAKKTLPTLKSHLQEAQQVKAEVTSGKSK